MDTKIETQRKTTPRWQTVLLFVITLTVTFAAASIGAVNQPGQWYEELKKPILTPPNWIFGPVWTVLYGMMGWAAGLVWQQAGLRRASTALGLYLIQLGLNAAWSWLFFGWHQPGLALVCIVFLGLAIAATISAFGRISAAAAGLMIPYLAWVSFASYLNFMFWKLNA
jgi:tryptophan-rich sensory protein